MSTPKATNSQIRYIQELQAQKGFKVAKTSRLEVMTMATASSWIGTLLSGMDPTKTSPKKKLRATSSNAYVRGTQARQGAGSAQPVEEPQVVIPYADRIDELQSAKLRAALKNILMGHAYGVDVIADEGFNILHRLEAGTF